MSDLLLRAVDQYHLLTEEHLYTVPGIAAAGAPPTGVVTAVDASAE